MVSTLSGRGPITGDSLVVMLIPGDRRLKSSQARKYLGVAEEKLVDISSASLCAGVELESEQLLRTTGAELVPIVSTRVYA